MSTSDHIAMVQAAIWHLMGTTRTCLRPTALISRVATETGLDPIEVKITLGALSRNKWLEGITSDGTPIGNVTATAPRPTLAVAPSLMAWRKAIVETGLSDSDLLALEDVHPKLHGLSASDLKAIAAGLSSIRLGKDTLNGMPSFIVSAHHLMGSSKLLASLAPTSLRQFGIDTNEFNDAPPYVVVAGPCDPISVILIENPQAFEWAIRAGIADRHALIVTFGYGLSRKGDDFGKQLAELIENRKSLLIPLVRTGSPASLDNLLAHTNLLFWGDLDPEGLRIFERLRKRLPQLKLSAIYQPMIDALQAGNGHPYVDAVGKGGQDTVNPKGISGDVMPLFEICRERGLDQEYVSISDIVALASEALPIGKDIFKNEKIPFPALHPVC
jgi:hypothetical protein